jgi:hypothetical protein
VTTVACMISGASIVVALINVTIVKEDMFKMFVTCSFVPYICFYYLLLL